MKPSAGERVPWGVFLAVLACGVVAITAMAWTTPRAAESGHRILVGDVCVKIIGTGNPTSNHGVNASVTRVRSTRLTSSAPFEPQHVFETTSDRQAWTFRFCDEAGTSHDLTLAESAHLGTGNGRPAMIETKDLIGFSELSSGRQELVESAIAVARQFPWLPYRYGGADPETGGFDCSGAMYYVMTRVGLNPPRTATGQYFWLRDHERLHSVPYEATTADHSSLAWLRPGDLLFWSTDPPADHTKVVNIAHVAMYLGREKKDGLQVMANATDGRSYRGIKANGYGVYDFRLSHEGSKSRLVGYGPPPGMTDIEEPTAPMSPGAAAARTMK
jgi:cell wall-associated NlpC family hydrolase